MRPAPDRIGSPHPIPKPLIKSSAIVSSLRQKIGLGFRPRASQATHGHHHVTHPGLPGSHRESHREV